MNTGIQDACNLGWKLALVADHRAGPSLLASFHAERWPVARRIRQLTDVAFLVEAGDAAVIGWLRRFAAPLLLPLLDGRTLPAPAFRLLGGLHIRYRGSRLAVDAGARQWRAMRAGDRLVDGTVLADGRAVRLHDALRPVGFHLLLCGRQVDFDRAAVRTLRDGAGGVPLVIHRLARRPAPGVLGDPDRTVLGRLGGRTAVYLVRPDGYIGYRSTGPGLDGVTRYLKRVLRGRAGGSAASPAAPSPPAAGGRS